MLFWRRCSWPLSAPVSRRGERAGRASCRCPAGCRRRSRSGSTTPTGWCRSGRRSSRGRAIVGAASNQFIPPQLRAKGAQTVYFDLYLNNRVGTPSQPADPATIQARADKLFDTAVTSSGCDHPLIAENELFGAQTADAVDGDDRAVPRERARLPAAARRARRAPVPAALEPALHPRRRSRTSGGGRRRQGRRPRPGGVLLRALGLEAGRRRRQPPLRATMRIAAGEPDPDRRPDQPARDDAHLQLDAESGRPRGAAAALAAGSTSSSGRRSRRSRSRASCTSRASGRGAGRPSTRRATTRTSRTPPAPGSGRATTRSATRPRSPGRSSTSRSTSARCCRRARSACSARPSCSRPTSPRWTRLTGDRELALSAELQHAVLAEARRSPRRASLQAERDVILDHFGGSRPAYRRSARSAPRRRRRSRAGSWRTSCGAARSRRRCAWPRRPAAQSQAVVRHVRRDERPAVRADRPVDWLGDARSGIAVSRRRARPLLHARAPAGRSRSTACR